MCFHIKHVWAHTFYKKAWNISIAEIFKKKLKAIAQILKQVCSLCLGQNIKIFSWIGNSLWSSEQLKQECFL